MTDSRDGSHAKSTHPPSPDENLEIPANAEAHVESEAFVTWRDGAVVVQRVKRYATVDEQQAREGLQDVAKISNGQTFPLMVDLREPASITAAARAYFASPEISVTSTRVALLQGSTVTALAGNLFVKINRPATETKIFTDEQKARRWLTEPR